MGYRVSAFVADGVATIRTRSGLDWTVRFPAIAAAAERLPVRSAVIDGEAVILDERGRWSFRPISLATAPSAVLYAFRPAVPRWPGAIEEAAQGAPPFAAKPRSRRAEMNIRLIIAIVAFASLTNVSFAACSQQDAMVKGSQLSQLVQSKMAQDPSAGQALMMKMQPIMQANQAKMTSGGSIDWDAVCTEYDALIKQAQ